MGLVGFLFYGLLIWLPLMWLGSRLGLFIAKTSRLPLSGIDI